MTTIEPRPQTLAEQLAGIVAYLDATTETALAEGRTEDAFRLQGIGLGLVNTMKDWASANSERLKDVLRTPDENGEIIGSIVVDGLEWSTEDVKGRDEWKAAPLLTAVLTEAAIDAAPEIDAEASGKIVRTAVDYLIAVLPKSVAYRTGFSRDPSKGGIWSLWTEENGLVPEKFRKAGEVTGTRLKCGEPKAKRGAK